MGEASCEIEELTICRLGVGAEEQDVTRLSVKETMCDLTKLEKVAISP